MASPARKLPEAVPERRPTGLPDWLTAQGYTPVPRGLFRELGRRLDYAAFLCLGIIFEETVGKPRPSGAPAPEFSHPIAEERFAHWTGLMMRRIRQALDRLDDLGISRRQKRGRQGCYAVAPDRLFQLPERPPRTVRRVGKSALSA